MMRREENLRPAVLVAALAAAVLGFALRLWQLRQGRDENGLWLGGSASVLALLALCVIAIVVFWLLSRRAAPRAAHDGSFAPGMASGVGYLAGGVLLAVGGLSAAAMQVGFGRAIGLAALLPAVQLVWHGLGLFGAVSRGCWRAAWSSPGWWRGSSAILKAGARIRRCWTIASSSSACCARCWACSTRLASRQTGASGGSRCFGA